MSSDTYKSIPALALYIDRIGAEELNFRRFIVKEKKGKYYDEKVIITIEPDRSIAVTKKEYAPTDDEAAAISLALEGVEFPHSIGARNINDLLKKLGCAREELFDMWSRKTGLITFVQQRRDFPDGSKAYLPWTLWSDGEWRCMEPGGLLPFWKPKTERTKHIMIHEGAKAARFVETMVTSNDPTWRAALAAHPFGADFKEYEHWGIIGGALSPYRADYKELHDASPSEVVYICDNDAKGKAALQEVARFYGRSLKGVMFGERWPYAWDCADPVPESFFSKAGRYKGRTLKQLMRPATYATEAVMNPSTGRPIHVLRSAFKEEWYHCVKPEVFIHRDWSNEIYTPPQFNNVIAPFSAVDDTARLVKKDAASKGVTLKYDPGTKPGVYSDKTGSYINTHCPSAVAAEKGDASPWEDYLKMLIPIESDREEVKRWCATLIALPAVKMHYGMLLISEAQGVGKSTLGEKILAPLVGWENTSVPTEAQIVESEFNYWLAHKRLAVVHEIYAGHSSKGYDRLKSTITDRFITVSRKYQDNYEVENWLHIFACSNSLRALKLNDDDRRWFVPGVGETIRPAEYWGGFNYWLTDENGLEIIKGWALNWVKKNKPVAPGAIAPWTFTKGELVEENYSPGQLLVSHALQRIKADYEDTPILTTDQALVELIRNKIYDGKHSDRLEKLRTVRKVAADQGWYVSKGKVKYQPWGLPIPTARLIGSLPGLVDRPAGSLASEGLSLFDLSSLIEAL